MSKKIPLTLIIDNQDRILGVKQFSVPKTEVVGVLDGGTGRSILEEDFVLIGNGNSPVITIPRTTIESNESFSFSFTDLFKPETFLGNSKIEIKLDDTKIDINDIVTTDDSVRIDRLGEWEIGMSGWEEGEDGLSELFIDTGEF